MPKDTLVINSVSRTRFFSVPLCLCVLSFFFSVKIFAQQTNLPLNYEWMQDMEGQMLKRGGFPLNYRLLNYEADTALQHQGARDTLDFQKRYKQYKDSLHPVGPPPAYPSLTVDVHTSMRPWIEHGHPMRKNIALQNSTNQHILIPTEKRFPIDIINYHRSVSLLHVERKAQYGEPVFRLYIDPMVNMQIMSVSNDTSVSKTYLDNNGVNVRRLIRFYNNTRGVTAHGDIGTKISFETSFWENQSFFPRYISEYANATQVIPGQGRWKAFKRNGYDYSMATGYISYSPNRFFNMQVGSGKHFVGDGYRSLLLSDNSFPYPFARFTETFGAFQYTTIYASLMNLISNAPVPIGTERLYQKKAAQFQQLSWNIGHIAEVSLFEGLIWSAADSRNKQCITLAYVNPIMFTSLPAFGLKDKNNFLLGATFHVDVLKTVRIYGQAVVDELGKRGTIGNKQGFQLGVKYYEVLGIRHLNAQFEYNQVNPYTYAAADSAQAYTHYNQPLAHPLGANFSEMIGSAQYKYGDFFVQVRASYAKVGADTAARDFGQNLFTSDQNAYFYPIGGKNKVGQGQKTTITFFDASIGYMVSYASNLNVCVGITVRNVEADATIDHTSFVYIAVRTSLTNTYYDFFRK